MALKLDKTKLVRNLAAGRKMVTHLEKYILDNPDFEWSYEYTRKKTDDGWHPSGDCTPPLLDLYHKAAVTQAILASDTYQKKPFGVGLLKTFQVGHFWHAYLQEIVVRAGLAPASSIERRGIKGWGEEVFGAGGQGRHLESLTTTFKPFHYATGSGDVAPITLPGETAAHVVDFKTMGSHDFKRQNMPDWCADKYECQINIYMDFFGLERGLFVCILKDSPHDMKEFEFVRNQPLIDAIYQKWEIVSACLEEGIEPPADEDFPLPLSGPAT